MTEPDHPTLSESDPVDDLLAECLEASDAERGATLDRICREHPELAVEMRERMRLLADIGLADECEAAEPFPDVLGDFRLLRRLGGGGMGVVYLAEQQSLGREVALKLIRPEHVYFPGARARFRREVEAAAGLEHPGIVKVFSVGEEQGIPFFAMERVQGLSLAELLAEMGKMAPERVTPRHYADAVAARVGCSADDVHLPGGSWVDICFQLTLQIADALRHAHERGIVHRDIKPSNVMLTRDGHTHVVDFGLSSTREPGDSKLTRTGSMVGSLAYMSPEQVRGQRVDHPTDVYSLGVLLYELLTLREAFFGETSEDVRRQILDARPKPVRVLNRRVPADAENVCVKAMAPERSQRYRDMAELAGDLRAYLARRPVAARRPGPWLRGRRFAQRHPTATAVASLALVTAVGVPSLLLLIERDARRRVEVERDVAQRVQDFMVQAFEHADPHHRGGPELSAEELLRRAAAADHGDLAPRVQAALAHATGRAFAGLGAWADAEHWLRRYLDLAPSVEGELARDEAFLARDQLAECLMGLGRAGEARTEIEAAIAELRRRRGDDAALLPHLQMTLAASWGNLDDKAKGEEVLRGVVEVLRRRSDDEPRAAAEALVRLAEMIGEEEWREPSELTEEALALLRAHGLEGTTTHVTCLRLRAHALALGGDRKAAIPVFREALAAGVPIYSDRHPLIAETRMRLALALAQTGDLDTAVAEATAVVDYQRSRPREEAAHDLLRALSFLSQVNFIRGDMEAAVSLQRESVELTEAIHGPDDPVTLRVHANYGRTLMAVGEVDDAVREHGIASDGHIAADRHTKEACGAVADHAWALHASGAHEAARQRAAQAVEWSRKLPQPHAETARVMYVDGVIASEQSIWPAARSAFESALAVHRDLGADSDPSRRLDVLDGAAGACEALGDFPALTAHLEEIVTLRRELAPGTADLAESLAALAAQLTLRGAGGDRDRALALLQESFDTCPADAAPTESLRDGFSRLLDLLEAGGDDSRAATVRERLAAMGVVR